MMTSLKPPKGYRRGLSDQTCHDMAERSLMSPLGQEALRQGWGRALYHYIMAWGSTPTKPETKAELQRQANEFMWDLADMRRIKDPDPLTKSYIRLYEARAAAEEELKRQYLRKET